MPQLETSSATTQVTYDYPAKKYKTAIRTKFNALLSIGYFLIKLNAGI